MTGVAGFAQAYPFSFLELSPDTGGLKWGPLKCNSHPGPRVELYEKPVRVRKSRDKRTEGLRKMDSTNHGSTEVGAEKIEVVGNLVFSSVRSIFQVVVRRIN